MISGTSTVAKTLGSIRRADCVEAELVLASGVYLTFRLDTSKVDLRSLVEVKRTRAHARHHESILIDARLLQAARRAALDAILKHRKAMHLKAAVLPRERRPVQLRFVY